MKANKILEKKFDALLCGALVTACFTLSAELTVRPYETVTNDVPSDTEQTASDLFVAPEGTLLKTGAGHWKVPTDATDQLQPYEITVLDGTVSFPTGSGTKPSAEVPAFLSTSTHLAFWIDASDSDATHLKAKEGGSATSVDTWYDVRETSVTSPTRNYFKTEYTHTANAPERVTTNGYQAVWFGGYTSGRFCTARKKDGSFFGSGETKFKHVFAVHGVLESYGNIFGSTNGSASSYVCNWGTVSKSATLTQTYLWDSQWSDVLTGRLYINGARTDLTTKVKKGFQLFEATTGVLNYNFVTALFSRSGGKDTSGGDYLCEVLVFDVELTEDERIAVQTYLTRKWFPNRATPRCSVRLREGAELSVSAGGDFYLPTDGAGTVIKTGSAEANAAYAEGFSDAPLDVQEGTVKCHVPAALKVAAGDTISATITRHGTQIGVTHAAGAGTLVKTGKAEVHLTGVPQGVERIDVQAGQLVFRAPTQDAMTDLTAPIPVEIPSADFESIPAEDMPGGVKDVKGDGLGGWHPAVNWNYAFVYDYDTWTAAVSGEADSATPIAWGVTKVRPPSGSRALMVRGSSGCYTTVTIPSAGLYELSFKACPRSTSDLFTGHRISFTDENNVEKVLAGVYRHNRVDDDRFRAIHWRVRFTEAGTYRLRIYGTSASSAVMYDDFALMRMPERAVVHYPIPGGTFEGADINAKYYTICTNLHTQDGWTFTDQANWTDPAKKGRPSVGVATPFMVGTYRDGGFFNFSRSYDGGFVNLLMRGTGGATGARAETTFTPPAGTYRLAAQIVKYGSDARSVAASVTINGQEHALGSVSASNKLFKRKVWPNTFTTDGSSEVTLKLVLASGTTTDSGMLLDDFELTTDVMSSAELVKGGNMSSTENWKKIETGFGTAWVGRNYHESHYAFGYEPDGSDGQFTSLSGNAGIAQDLALEAGTRYCVSASIHGRTNNDGTYYPQPVLLAFAKDGVTNVVGRVVCRDLAGKIHENDHHRRAFYFVAPEAGTYTLVIRADWDSTYATTAEVHVDDVSVKSIDVACDDAPPFAANTRITIAEGAMMTLDFKGTNRIDVLRLGGHAVFGFINAATHPKYFAGQGTFEVVRKGFTLICR